MRVPTRLRPIEATDILVAMALMLVGAFAALTLPDGHTLRYVLAIPVLFFAPGYLLIQGALGPRSRPSARGWHGLVAVGVSPALVGLFALATALLPGGFQLMPIVLSVTVGTLLLGILGLYRRSTSAPTAASPSSRSDASSTLTPSGD